MNKQVPQPSIFKLRKSSAAVVVALTILAAPAAQSQEAPKAADEDVVTLDNVTVTSRNREELAQDIPVPVSVVSGATLERDNVVGIAGLTQKVPNLGLFGSNPRQTSISIRGIGKNAANDTMEPSVGVIVDGVTSAYVGQNWTDWVDLDRIEVIRGPQGTLLGKNTTLGVINITTKAPSFTPAYVYEARLGSYNNLEGKFSATGPIVDNVLAYRGSFFINKKDGVLNNTWQSGPETWNETYRVGGRLQFLLTPSKDLSARIILDQIQSSENGNKSLLVNNGPATFADGPARTTTFQSRLSRSYFNNSDGSTYQPVYGNNQIEDSQARPQRTRQSGASAEINKNLANGFALTSITAWREQYFDIKNGGVTRFDIGNGGQQLWNKQLSQELRLTSPLDAKIDYQVGLYALKAKVYSDDPTSFGADGGAFNASNAQYAALSAPQYRGLLRASQDGVYRSYVLEPKTTSLAAFGQANWHVTDKATITAGLRDTQEKKQGRNRRELDRAGSALTNDTGTDNSKAGQYGLNLANAADLAAWNAAKALYTNAIGGAGGVYDWKQGEQIDSNSVSWLLSPSYKVTDNVLLYGSASQGEKSGAVEFVTASGATLGTPQNVRPEKARNYELGVKSVFLNHALLFNANLYQITVTDYQSNLTVEDTTSTTGLRTYLGNIPGVRARGLELEANYAATRNLKVNLNASFNRAVYLDYSTLAPDTSTAQLVNFAGRQLHGAPKVIVNAGFDYAHPIGSYLGRVFVNNAYRSGTYLAANQSENTYQAAYSLLDAGLTFGTRDGRYELSVVGKNLTDKDYATGAGTYSGSGAITVQPGYDRTFAVVFRAKL
ncbi:TonB-dependent receptor [Massilia sp. CF038]|uniref:TonB-dependent receptor n=1 Tax=Massilia sp. CF038 TaxID=1881045 RepID=UPI000923AD0F|nr:TonB-dependent receptor [Massilia sp. CF038]SHH08249.1 iron complex outermembrane recepter protein [Massilia sp. CF038]